MKEVLESNSRKRRDRLYIIADILSIAKSGSLKTQIMYKANLSFAQLNEYLSFLLETKLIVSNSRAEKTVYKVTSKGMRFLQNYAKIRDLLKADGKRAGENSTPIFTLDGNCYKIRD
ncbi:MAG: hypothetical protein JSV58_01825 [Candidatus Bathyarchaeota archaeon]|nr:MAG: hypothetical protein JSV58_01825 [Candidatus Bathyarchaeota archaeon]